MHTLTSVMHVMHGGLVMCQAPRGCLVNHSYHSHLIGLILCGCDKGVNNFVNVS